MLLISRNEKDSLAEYLGVKKPAVKDKLKAAAKNECQSDNFATRSVYKANWSGSWCSSALSVVQERLASVL